LSHTRIRLAVLTSLSWVLLTPLLPVFSAPAGTSADFPGRGWDTWDISRPNAMIYMPDGIVVELTIYDPETGKSFGRPFLKDVRHFGAHAPDGSYCFARYEQGALTYEVEFAHRGNSLVAHVRPLTPTKYLLVADISFFFGRTGTAQKQGDGLVASGKSGKFYASSPNAGKIQEGLTNDHDLVWDLTGDRWVTVMSQPASGISEAECRSELDSARKAYERDRVQSDGFLANGAEAASDVAAWNVVWSPSHDLPVTTVAREFPAGSGIGWGGYIQGGWDAVFQSIVADLQSPAMAEASIRGLMSDQAKRGFLGGGTPWGAGEDHSQPSVAAYAVLKFYKQHGNKKILADAFPVLYRWHEWWFTARDGNKDGLLEWGSDPVSDPKQLEYYQKVADVLTDYMKRVGLQVPQIKTSDVMDNLSAAGMESGLDNSQMWDGVTFNKQTHTMEQDDVGLNCFYALDAWSLGEIAHVLGRSTEEHKLRQEFAGMRDRINTSLWSDKDGMYFNKRWDGSFNRRISPTNFYPMLIGIAGPEMTERMVKQYLLNPEKFWGEYVVPTTPRDDPAFRDNGYWRGRIWAPTNYLVYEGLKRSGQYEIAGEVAQKSVALFLKEYQAKGHMHENYNTNTAAGDDVPSSTSYYGWAGLLPLMMVEELIDVEPWSTGLRLGTLSTVATSVRNVQVMNDLYDVAVGPGLSVSRNGQKLVQSNNPVILRDVVWGKDHIRFDVTAKNATELRLYGFHQNEQIESQLPSRKTLTAVDGSLTINVNPETKSVDLRFKNR
jgi:putative isomerase